MLHAFLGLIIRFIICVIQLSSKTSKEDKSSGNWTYVFHRKVTLVLKFVLQTFMYLKEFTVYFHHLNFCRGTSSKSSTSQNSHQASTSTAHTSTVSISQEVRHLYFSPSAWRIFTIYKLFRSYQWRRPITTHHFVVMFKTSNYNLELNFFGSDKQ